MEIVFDFPPNIEELRKHFTLKKTVVFTYGNKLYNPGRGNIDEHLMKHEQTHSRQQSSHLTPAEWWGRYIEDPKFRLSQELEAYRIQYKSFAVDKDRNKTFLFLHGIASDLSSGIYGNAISYDEAKRLIRQ